MSQPRRGVAVGHGGTRHRSQPVVGLVIWPDRGAGNGPTTWPLSKTAIGRPCFTCFRVLPRHPDEAPAAGLGPRRHPATPPRRWRGGAPRRRARGRTGDPPGMTQPNKFCSVCRITHSGAADSFLLQEGGVGGDPRPRRWPSGGISRPVLQPDLGDHPAPTAPVITAGVGPPPR